MTVRAGRYRQKVDIMRATKTRDGSGYVTTWGPHVAGVPAQVVGLAGREGVMEKVFQSVRVFEITMRYRADLQPDDQLRWDGVDLNILSAEDREGRRRELVIIAETESAEKTG